jgi:hypothetical protein
VALTHLNVTSRPLEGGRSFGTVGAYEELRGEAQFAVDPHHPLNTVITDLDLAPRDAAGRVPFSADVRILRPVDSARGNRGLFFDVVNRGTSIFVRMTEPGPLGPTTTMTQGWLLQRGYTVVSCGWQHDVPRGGARFGLTAPRALLAGDQVRGVVTTTKQLDAPADVLEAFEAGSTETAYAAADLSDPSATLSVRDAPHGVPSVVPRAHWRFLDSRHIACDGGFEPGKIYEVAYTAVGAPITGIGFLALRDLAAHLKFASPEQHAFAVAMGASQTGRMLRQLVALGCCEDEQGRLAIDGILAIAGGARVTEANYRFGQPSAQGPMPAVFPYTDAVQREPATGQVDGLLRRPLERGRVPRILYLNTSSEYWSGSAIVHVSAGLSHVTADVASDVEVPDNVRIHHLSGTQHAPAAVAIGQSEVPNRAVYAPNIVDYKPFVRAAIDNLCAWITHGTEPPPSTYPRFDNETLMRDGLLPAVDSDGNELAGLRHPDVSVPLATYTGWNPRGPGTGGERLLARVTGATIPLARTRAERLASGDQRPSVEERYSSRAAFVGLTRDAAEALVGAGYLLAEDVEEIVSVAAERWDALERLTDLGPLPPAAAPEHGAADGRPRLPYLDTSPGTRPTSGPFLIVAPHQLNNPLLQRQPAGTMAPEL